MSQISRRDVLGGGGGVAQLYVHDRVASVTRLVRELKGFRRVALALRASAEVSFRLTREDLTFIGADLTRRAEPGDFGVWVAPSSVAGEAASFELKS